MLSVYFLSLTLFQSSYNWVYAQICPSVLSSCKSELLSFVLVHITAVEISVPTKAKIECHAVVLKMSPRGQKRL